MSVLHFIFFLLLLPPASSDAISTPAGCLDRCGNVSIPYPFGIGSDCSLNPAFNITCNTSTDPPHAYVSFLEGTQVIEIKASQIRVKRSLFLYVDCYTDNRNRNLMALRPQPHGSETGWSSSKGSSSPWHGIDLTESPFTISGQNWLTAIGCDDMVLGLGTGNVTFGGGCAAFCDANVDSSKIGFCSAAGSSLPGNGCCRTPVPRGIDYLAAQFMDISEKWRFKRLYNCSYAFVEEKAALDDSNFTFPLSDLDRPEKLQKHFWGRLTNTGPIFRLDWRIGTESCTQAKLNTTTFACKHNTECVDAEANVEGYLCRCLKGYQGNPYLNQGCQDINECDDNPPCAQNSMCVNYPGTFKCRCDKGYYGDGKANGFGCVRLPRRQTAKNIIAIGLGSGIGFLLLLSICFWLRKKFVKRKVNLLKQKFFQQNGGLLLQQKTNEGTIRKTKHFPIEELEKATDNFNGSRILGQGGQGTVYKGILSDGEFVAIKKLKKVDVDQLEYFINEVVILSQIDHRNIVKLLGCCLDNEVPLLLYEFVPNGTLFNLIHDREAKFTISWNMRLKIATDIAGALSYLHFSTSTPIYHRDIKSSNILLGEKFVVKVSDFGTSKSVEVDKTHLTTLVKGTFGYLDPEYFRSSQFTDKSDVYSFGVVLVELLSGLKPVSSKASEEETSLVMRFLASMEQNKIDSILDPLVMEQGLNEEMIAVARLAERCLHLQGRMRPSMKEVATELANYSHKAQMSSVAKDDQFEEAREYEAKNMSISDVEYTSTISVKSDYFSSSDAHPLMA